MEQTLFYSFLLLLIVSSSYQSLISMFMKRAQLELRCTKYYNKGELYYDCSNKNLITIPDLPTNIVYLNLQHNKIVDLTSYHLRNMGNLKVLDLSFNYLKSINNVSFHGLMMLQQLRLNNNKLGYDVTVFPISCLLPLKSLKQLSVQNNGFTNYPLKQIAHLTNLEVLQMDIGIDSKTYRLLALHKRYCNFLHLNSLFLYFRVSIKKAWQNMIKHALLYNFILILFILCSYFLHAKENRAHMCKENYEKEELHVDCSYNIKKEFIIMQFYGSRLHSNVFSINLQHNSITFIEYNQFRSLRSLRVLDLSFNNIRVIGYGAFNGLEKLQQLRLNDNKLKYDTIAFPIMSFQPLKSLKLLSIENNDAYRTSIFPNTIAHLTKLEILKLDVHIHDISEQNSTKSFGKFFCKLLHLHSLHLHIKSNIDVYKKINYNNFFQYTPNITQLHIIPYSKTFSTTSRTSEGPIKFVRY
ncbi:uncharacterized protein LOC143042918 [Mytilus galloprovincialis]|uniref:uncharacterized protein LOC143042918 n=1 Tax=Mytilus galloprovincialis TaxID=29158 RepID=UPI003F7BA8C0